MTKIISYIVGFLIALFLVWCFFGCKAPKETEKTVITVKHDTLITKEIHRDTIYHNVFSRDTMYLKESKLTVKYVYKGDSNAFIGGTVLPDTVIKVYRDTLREKTIIQQVVKPKTKWDWLQYWVTVILVIIVTIKYGGPFVMALLRKIPNFPF